MALLAEAQVDAAVRHGLAAPLAAQLVAETMAGTAALLAARDYDTLAVRREVTSPGGSTARGLAALERGGVRSAFQDAIDAVIDWAAVADAGRRRSRGSTSPNYVSALFEVYIIVIFVYILLNMMFSFGLRPAVLALARTPCSTSCGTCSEPYLRIFRR